MTEIEAFRNEVWIIQFLDACQFERAAQTKQKRESNSMYRIRRV